MAKSNQPRRKYLDPKILQSLDSLELVAREVVEGVRVGMHRSPLRGFSTEFSQHRPYVPGDAIRHLDWRVHARTSKYYVKLYEAETNFTANILLDASSSMLFKSNGISKLEYAKYAAASLAYLIILQRDSVGLGVFDSELKAYVEPKSTLGILQNIDELLSEVEPRPKTNVGSLLHEFARRIHRKAFVIIFSDLFDSTEEVLSGLDHLRFRGHNVVLFHVLDPYELNFPLDGTWKFRGLELEGDVVTQPQRIRAAYLDALRNFLFQVRSGCERTLVDYVLVDTSRPVESVLISFLARRVRRAVK